ncbi:major facilitator superfamily domain-containing protein [Truncatella angustata]|uniref:Major facilitator superfamily domain-containing protein n=1 Tax=Truncatella angustata TaxID=152316 RepID=A0A9P8UDR1_9PEZI|nr:major facilitator superfamily domain-containing protein [Truncatella angustata]KAH6648043.1 major facilitator superfamily domain-containing protein [Truncatella angustata]
MVRCISKDNVKFSEEKNPALLSPYQQISPLTGHHSHAGNRANFSQSQLDNLDQHEARLEILEDGTVLAGWFSSEDCENPRNWQYWKKLFVLMVVCVNTFVVYMAAPIYSPAYSSVEADFKTSELYSTLGLALYVLGYGFGPLLFSPLSEIPAIGRNPPYVVSFALFCIFSVPTALVANAPGFMVLRFLQGFFGSPILATGGASIADIFDETSLPHAMSFWVVPCYFAPAVGPIISSFAIPALGWRFSMWEVLISAGPVMLLLLFVPETSSSTLLFRRAQRLRQLTGTRISSASEVAQSHLSLKNVVVESLLMPLKITVLDPAILFAEIYTSLIYGIYYSFFEAFPLVYEDIYGLSPAESTLPFIACIAGCIVAAGCYHAYLHQIHIPALRKSAELSPEAQLIPGLFASIAPPIGLLLFGWAANASVHWIVPTLGIVIYPAGVFVLMQCMFMYIPASYPQYAASLFAASDATRCSFACAAVLFATPLYKNLGIGPGCSLLAGLTILCAFGLYGLYRYGAALRARSKITVKS